MLKVDSNKVDSNKVDLQNPPDFTALGQLYVAFLERKRIYRHELAKECSRSGSGNQNGVDVWWM